MPITLMVHRWPEIHDHPAWGEWRPPSTGRAHLLPIQEHFLRWQEDGITFDRKRGEVSPSGMFGFEGVDEDETLGMGTEIISKAVVAKPRGKRVLGAGELGVLGGGGVGGNGNGAHGNGKHKLGDNGKQQAPALPEGWEGGGGCGEVALPGLAGGGLFGDVVGQSAVRGGGQQGGGIGLGQDGRGGSTRERVSDGSQSRVGGGLAETASVSSSRGGGAPGSPGEEERKAGALGGGLTQTSSGGAVVDRGGSSSSSSSSSLGGSAGSSSSSSSSDEGRPSTAIPSNSKDSSFGREGGLSVRDPRSRPAGRLPEDGRPPPGGGREQASSSRPSSRGGREPATASRVDPKTGRRLSGSRGEPDGQHQRNEASAGRGAAPSSKRPASEAARRERPQPSPVQAPRLHTAPDSPALQPPRSAGAASPLAAQQQPRPASARAAQSPLSRQSEARARGKRLDPMRLSAIAQKNMLQSGAKTPWQSDLKLQGFDQELNFTETVEPPTAAPTQFGTDPVFADEAPRRSFRRADGAPYVYQGAGAPYGARGAMLGRARGDGGGAEGGAGADERPPQSGPWEVQRGGYGVPAGGNGIAGVPPSGGMNGAARGSAAPESSGGSSRSGPAERTSAPLKRGIQQGSPHAGTVMAGSAMESAAKSPDSSDHLSAVSTTASKGSSQGGMSERGTASSVASRAPPSTSAPGGRPPTPSSYVARHDSSSSGGGGPSPPPGSSPSSQNVADHYPANTRMAQQHPPAAPGTTSAAPTSLANANASHGGPSTTTSAPGQQPPAASSVLPDKPASPNYSGDHSEITGSSSSTSSSFGVAPCLTKAMSNELLQKCRSLLSHVETAVRPISSNSLIEPVVPAQLTAPHLLPFRPMALEHVFSYVVG